MEQQEKELREEYSVLKQQIEEPDFYASKNHSTVSKRASELVYLLGLFDERRDLLETKAKTQKAIDDPELSSLKAELQLELEQLDSMIASHEAKLIEALTPQDPNNDRDVIMEIRAAAGGDESSLFAGELYRMYSRWAENHSYKIELLGEAPSEAGGFKEIIFAVRGPEAYKNLKFEAGVHRVQRVPVTESRPDSHFHHHRGRAARGRGNRHRYRPDRPAHRRLPLLRPRWPVGQHYRLGGAHHSPANRDGGHPAGRKIADPKQG